MRLVLGTILQILQLIHMECLTLENQLVALVLQRLAFLVHYLLELVEMAKLHLQLLHLGLHELRDKRLYSALLDLSQVFGFYSGCGESRRSGSLNVLVDFSLGLLSGGDIAG